MENLKTEKNAPLSPAPSHAEMLPSGFNDLIMHNTSTSSYAQEMDTGRMKAQPESRHTSPFPQQAMYPGIDPGSSYHHPPAGSYQQAYAQDSPYPTLPDEMESNAYSTPATSPPTPSRATDARTTRSGAVVPSRGSKTTTSATLGRVRVEKAAPKKKRDRAGKAARKVVDIDTPISVLTKDSPVEVYDIESWVNRSTSERTKEIELGKQPGKIKRPMNAFMLYRKAYQNRAKDHWKHHNHQIISQVCGDSWNIESDSVRQQFNDWAKLERDNHQKAHPNYKFTPAKPNRPSPARSRSRDFGEDDSDLDDYDWNTSRARRANGREDQDGDYQPPRSLGYYSTPASYHLNAMGASAAQLAVMPPQHHQSRPPFGYSNPGRAMPAQYNDRDLHAQYYQASLAHPQHSQMHGNVDDSIMRKASSPGMAFHQGPPQQQQQHHSMHYEHLMKPYAGQHLTQQASPPIQRQAQPHHMEQRIDPILQDGVGGPLFVDASGFHTTGNTALFPMDAGGQAWPTDGVAGDNGQGAAGMYSGAFAGLDETLLQDSQQTQLLRGGDSDWQVEALDGGQFDNAWPETPPHGDS